MRHARSRAIRTSNLHPGSRLPVSAGRDRVSEIARWRGPTISEFQAMASPTYGLDVVALAFAVVLAAALVLLISHLMPLLADVMP